jgi:hypothetical protein
VGVNAPLPSLGFETRIGSSTIADSQYGTWFGKNGRLQIASHDRGDWQGRQSRNVCAKLERHSSHPQVVHRLCSSLETNEHMGNRFDFDDADGHVLVSFRIDVGGLTAPTVVNGCALVDVAPRAQSLPKLRFLIIVGYYLIVLQQENGALVSRL